MVSSGCVGVGVKRVTGWLVLARRAEERKTRRKNRSKIEQPPTVLDVGVECVGPTGAVSMRCAFVWVCHALHGRTFEHVAQLGANTKASESNSSSPKQMLKLNDTS